MEIATLHCKEPTNLFCFIKVLIVYQLSDNIILAKQVKHIAKWRISLIEKEGLKCAVFILYFCTFYVVSYLMYHL